MLPSPSVYKRDRKTVISAYFFSVLKEVTGLSKQSKLNLLAVYVASLNNTIFIHPYQLTALTCLPITFSIVMWLSELCTLLTLVLRNMKISEELFYNKGSLCYKQEDRGFEFR
jgi:hypothetical protein